MRHAMMVKKDHGVTLIELLIVIVVTFVGSPAVRSAAGGAGGIVFGLTVAI